MTLVDTAGARDTQDVVEREGVARGEQARARRRSDAGGARPQRAAVADDRQLLDETRAARGLIVGNKCDLPAGDRCGELAARPAVVRVSALTGMDSTRCARRSRAN